MYGFDSETEVLVRGFGFEKVSAVGPGYQVATLKDGKFDWELPLDFKNYNANEVQEITGPRFNSMCGWSNTPYLKDTEWVGDKADSITFSKRSYDIESFVVLVSNFLLGGQISSEGLIVIEPEEPLMVALEDLGLKHEIVGSYLDINLPQVLRWFFLLFGSDTDRRIPETIKSLNSSLLEVIWKRFVGESITTKRLKADLSEIVLKSGEYPKWDNRERLCIVNNNNFTSELKNRFRLLRNIKTETGYLLTKREGKITWNETREIRS